VGGVASYRTLVHTPLTLLDLAGTREQRARRIPGDRTVHCQYLVARTSFLLAFSAMRQRQPGTTTLRARAVSCVPLCLPPTCTRTRPAPGWLLSSLDPAPGAKGRNGTCRTTLNCATGVFHARGRSYPATTPLPRRRPPSASAHYPPLLLAMWTTRSWTRSFRPPHTVTTFSSRTGVGRQTSRLLPTTFETSVSRARDTYALAAAWTWGWVVGWTLHLTFPS